MTQALKIIKNREESHYKVDVSFVREKECLKLWKKKYYFISIKWITYEIHCSK